MTERNTGGPASPCWIPTGGDHAMGEPPPMERHSGMTLRDYFAAKALPAAINYWRWDSESDVVGALDPEFSFSNDEGGMALIAQTAYEMADAMLKERAK